MFTQVFFVPGVPVEKSIIPAQKFLNSIGASSVKQLAISAISEKLNPKKSETTNGLYIACIKQDDKTSNPVKTKLGVNAHLSSDTISRYVIQERLSGLPYSTIVVPASDTTQEVTVYFFEVGPDSVIKDFSRSV